jgi:hypothetical protein
MATILDREHAAPAAVGAQVVQDYTARRLSKKKPSEHTAPRAKDQPVQAGQGTI